MKVKLFKSVFVIAIAIIAGINVYNAQKTVVLSDVSMANVEALASGEINPECPNGCVEGNDGCYCFKKYPNYSEAKWTNTNL